MVEVIDMDWLVFTGFIFALLLIFFMKALRVYHTYRGKIFKYIYSGFLEYYFKYRYRKDLSVSSWLNHNLGFHRILYNSYLNEERKVIHDFVTIFHEKGICVFCIIPSDGVITGNHKDKHWIVSRGDKNYRILNPLATIESHAQFIAEQFPDIEIIDKCILFNDQADFSKLNVDIPLARYHELLNQLLAQDRLVKQEAILDIFAIWKKRK
jgi:hypothetical protein